ncbi:MAG: hypothetical protein MT490_05440 [Sphingomonas sp.]|uniref:hypothetical protein n=1 Tax=Sphingomonas sp. TaxID=28214 RepID=UPI002273E290|nr:hypothetical protein [Sphingomonas sp.]MCX8475224.1 hypothetical protein [Sphingomonas sp.]
MKWLMIGGVPAVLAGGVYFHGPLATGETYARPASEVAQVLENLTLPKAVTRMVESVPNGAYTRDVVPGKSVTYFFHARGGQAAKFVATYQAVDATHTRVSTSMTMSGDAETLLKSRFMPLAKQFATVGEVAMREQIDARLEQRDFDKGVVTEAMKGYAMANMGEIQKSAAAAMEEAAELHSEFRASRYTPPPGQPAFDAGRPMVNPTPGAR